MRYPSRILRVTNHPNRNWRARMRAAADQWLASVAIPPDGVAHVATPAQVRQMLRTAYLAGYTDARKPNP